MMMVGLEAEERMTMMTMMMMTRRRWRRGNKVEEVMDQIEIEEAVKKGKWMTRVKMKREEKKKEEM